MGALESFEAATLHLLMPTGESESYDKTVREANRLLLRTLKDDVVHVYDVSKPGQTFFMLDRLIFNLVERSRVLVLPLGPKIFTGLSCILAINYFPRVTVWRISGLDRTAAINRVPSGRVISVLVSLKNAIR